MARAMWSGMISFGLVNIPVKMFPAVRDNDISFRMLHAKDHVPVRRKLVCPADGEEVGAKDTVKGYEISKDRYVILEPKELEAVRSEAERTIEIMDFADLEDIDPI